MRPEDDAPAPRELALGSEDLDGHTIEELTDYLEADRTPADPSIDGSPACLLALDALDRLRGLTPVLIAADTAAEPEADEGWIQRVLSGIALDAHAGRRIPLPAPGPDADLGITEGAVRGLIRAAEGAVPGLLVGRCRFDGDVTSPGAPVRVLVEASAPYGVPLTRTADQLRAEITARLAAHTALNITAIDITIRDVRGFLS